MEIPNIIFTVVLVILEVFCAIASIGAVANFQENALAKRQAWLTLGWVFIAFIETITH